MLEVAEKSLVQRTQPLEYFGPRQETMKLDELGPRSLDLLAHLVEWTSRKVVPLGKPTLSITNLDMSRSARHVYCFEDRLAEAVQGAHQPGAGLFRAPEKRPQPAGAHEDIVVDEDHVLAPCLLKAKISRFGRRKIPRASDQLESSRSRFRFEVSLGLLGGAPVHVDQVERDIRLPVKAFQ